MGDELDPSNTGGVTKATFQLWWINFTQANAVFDKDGIAVVTNDGRTAAASTAEYKPEDVPYFQQLLNLEIPDVSVA